MKPHDWQLKYFSPKGIWNGNFYSQPEALTNCLKELEKEGNKIFDVSITHGGVSVWILYYKRDE